MRSEKLKKLINDKTPLKFKFTINEHQESQELQDFMFASGIGWLEEQHFELRALRKPMIITETIDGTYCMRRYMSEERFNDDKKQTFHIYHDCLVEEEKEEEKSVTIELPFLYVNGANLSPVDGSFRYIEEDGKCQLSFLTKNTVEKMKLIKSWNNGNMVVQFYDGDIYHGFEKIDRTKICYIENNIYFSFTKFIEIEEG